MLDALLILMILAFALGAAAVYRATPRDTDVPEASHESASD